MNKAERLPARILLKNGISGIADKIFTFIPKKKSVRVLTYHNITDSYMPGDAGQETTPREIFDDQMRYLKTNGYRAVSADEILNILTAGRDIPDKVISITFDDGYRDNYLNALPVLSKYGFRATLFVTSGLVGKGRSRFGEYITWQDIEGLKNSGLFSFGCHSMSHLNLAKARESALIREIRDARNVLEDKIGGRVKTFAYPFGWYGAFNRRIAEAVKGEGFECAFTGIYGGNSKNTDLFYLRRTSVSWADEPENIGRILRGSYDWYRLYQKAVSLWATP